MRFTAIRCLGATTGPALSAFDPVRPGAAAPTARDAATGATGRDGLRELNTNDLTVVLVLRPDDASAATRLPTRLDVELRTNLHRLFDDETHAPVTYVESPRRRLISGAAQRDAV